MNNVSDIQVIRLPTYKREDGEVVVAETAESVPFNIARMFGLRAPAGSERGKHAHRRCTQLMVCLHGLVDVVCDDGKEKSTHTLDRIDTGLLVPPAIWNTVVFREPQSVLVVLCDRVFEEDDYLRTYEEFQAYRKAGYT